MKKRQRGHKNYKRKSVTPPRTRTLLRYVQEASPDLVMESDRRRRCVSCQATVSAAAMLLNNQAVSQISTNPVMSEKTTSIKTVECQIQLALKKYYRHSDGGISKGKCAHDPACDAHFQTLAALFLYNVNSNLTQVFHHSSSSSEKTFRKTGPREPRLTAVRRKCFRRFTRPWISPGEMVQIFIERDGSSGTPLNVAMQCSAPTWSVKLMKA